MPWPNGKSAANALICNSVEAYEEILPLKFDALCKWLDSVRAAGLENRIQVEELQDIIKVRATAGELTYMQLMLLVRSQFYSHLVVSVGMQPTQVACGPSVAAVTYLPPFAVDAFKLLLEFVNGALRDKTLSFNGENAFKNLCRVKDYHVTLLLMFRSSLYRCSNNISIVASADFMLLCVYYFC